MTRVIVKPPRARLACGHFLARRASAELTWSSVLAAVALPSRTLISYHGLHPASERHRLCTEHAHTLVLAGCDQSPQSRHHANATLAEFVRQLPVGSGDRVAHAQSPLDVLRSLSACPASRSPRDAGDVGWPLFYSDNGSSAWCGWSRLTSCVVVPPPIRSGCHKAISRISMVPSSPRSRVPASIVEDARHRRESCCSNACSVVPFPRVGTQYRAHICLHDSGRGRCPQCLYHTPTGVALAQATLMAFMRQLSVGSDDEVSHAQSRYSQRVPPHVLLTAREMWKTLLTR